RRHTISDRDWSSDVCSSDLTAADALTIALGATRAAGEAVGSYVTTATATGAALDNYTVTYVVGTFNITKAAATVTAHDGTKMYRTEERRVGKEGEGCGMTCT